MQINEQRDQFDAQCREAIAQGERLADDHLKAYTQNAVAAERERCARIAETEPTGMWVEIAARIRSGE